jgi:diguanylate cyclase (GGDEF)-like protein
MDWAMTLDIPTLMFAGSFAAIMCSAFLVFIWWQKHESMAALWWAAGNLALGAGVICLSIGFVGNHLPIFLAGLTLIVLSPALTWSGVRAFNGKAARPLLVAAGPVAWVVLSAALGDQSGGWIGPIASSLLAIAYYCASLWELRQQHEDLRARAPLMLLFALHIAVLSLSIPSVLDGSMTSLEPPPLASLFGLIHFETIIFVTGTTLFFVALKRERAEFRQRRDAETDVLTNLPNRRAFLAAAERLAERCRRDRQPFSVAVFDLDHFKRVNDTYGHRIGDRTLQVFADVAREALRPGDIISRIGGEEFAAVFPGTDLQSACKGADRVRTAFLEAAGVVEGRELAATVSAGVAVAGHEEPLAELMERADAALYQAKLSGRDRVEYSKTPHAYPHLVQVA